MKEVNKNSNNNNKTIDGPPKAAFHNSEDCITWFAALTTYFSYALLILFGHIRDYLGKITGNSRYFNASARSPKVCINYTFLITV